MLTLIERIKDGQKLGRYSYQELQEIRRSLINSYKDIFHIMCHYVNAKYESYDGMEKAKEIYDNFKEWYKPFFEKIIKENNDIAFISLNYDVLIDLVFQDMGDNGKAKDFTYGFDVYNLASQDEKCKMDGVLLLKPHGAINFVQCCKCEKVYTYPFGAEGISSGHKCKACNETLDTLILPPMFNKDEKYRRFADINRKVSKVIAEATEILIIGYSLPDYDINIIEAFLKGVLNNRSRKDDLKVEIVDSNRNAKFKYDTIFGWVEEGNCYCEGFKKYAEKFLSNSL